VTTWVDTHCHLHMSEREPASLIARAAAVGVEWMVSPGTDVAGSEASARLAEQFPGVVLSTAGLHPHDAEHWLEQRDQIAELAQSASAIGECGLDFYRNLSPPDAQRQAFREQLQLASELAKPIIVHCRDAFRQVHEDLAESGHDQIVLHCWTGGPKWTKRFDELGVTFSFAGPVTFDGGDTVRRAAAVVPRTRTIIETDTPYLTPPPDRSAPNEPANVVRVGEVLAQVWGESVEEVARLTTAEATRVFRA
jgi:TatD DNase family protein